MKDEGATLGAERNMEGSKETSRSEHCRVEMGFWPKKDANGEVQAHRARLVVQGDYQIEGIDVFDTFSPVARLVSIRTVLAMSAPLDWAIHQVSRTKKSEVHVCMVNSFPTKLSTCDHLPKSQSANPMKPYSYAKLSTV
jgi:hypothetical protein